jgi:hypothetical protein
VRAFFSVDGDTNIPAFGRAVRVACVFVFDGELEEGVGGVRVFVQTGSECCGCTDLHNLAHRAYLGRDGVHKDSLARAGHPTAEDEPVVHCRFFDRSECLVAYGLLLGVERKLLVQMGG